MRLTVVILAGGRSRRMGRDKALMPCPGFPSLLKRQLALASTLRPTELLVSCRPDQQLDSRLRTAAPRLEYAANVRHIHDDGRHGPLAGVASALDAMRGDALFVLGVDLPRMTSHVASRVLGAGAIDGSRGVIPLSRHGLEPLVSLLPRAAATFANDQLATGDDLSLRRFARTLLEAGLAKSFAVAPYDHFAFTNWNTRADQTTRPDQFEFGSSSMITRPASEL